MGVLLAHEAFGLRTTCTYILEPFNLQESESSKPAAFQAGRDGARGLNFWCYLSPLSGHLISERTVSSFPFPADKYQHSFPSIMNGSSLSRADHSRSLPSRAFPFNVMTPSSRPAALSRLSMHDQLGEIELLLKLNSVCS